MVKDTRVKRAYKKTARKVDKRTPRIFERITNVNKDKDISMNVESLPLEESVFNKTDPITEILKDRGSKYGLFNRQAYIAQALKNIIHFELDNKRMTPDYIREALDMILHKIARIVNGDPLYEDSWVDIIGYTQLVLNGIREEKEKRKENQ